MTLIDSHCHLDFPDFADEIEDVVARAEVAGVTRMTTVSTRVSQASGLRRSPSAFPQSISPSARTRTTPPRSPRRTLRRSARSQAIPNASASARPGSTIITITRRRTSPSACSARKLRWPAS
jgi:hypothetical protein